MKRVVAALLLAMALGGRPAAASGSYIGGPPRTPQRTDVARYELGKSLYLGKTELPAAALVPAESQSPCLTLWQNKIPRSAQKPVDLPSLAGRLSEENFKALAYFIEVRFNVKCDTALRP